MCHCAQNFALFLSFCQALIWPFKKHKMRFANKRPYLQEACVKPLSTSAYERRLLRTKNLECTDYTRSTIASHYITLSRHSPGLDNSQFYTYR